MEKDQFVKAYVAQYVAAKMATVARDEVLPGNRHIQLAEIAFVDGSQIWESLFKHTIIK